MKRHTGFVLTVVLLMVVLCGSEMYPAKAECGPRPEVRALWVDAFHDGVKTPVQVDKLVNDAITANINTLIVQVRRRGDAYYNITNEPRTEDPVLEPGFDALKYLIDRAHASNIEVHAWLNTLVAWNSATPPKDPQHVWNLHGPNATGVDNWVSYYRINNNGWSDKLYSSYYLDPGNPDAVDYTTDVYLNVVKNYDVDGIHLDYSRYAGLGWGYNPTAVARFNERYGRTGLPAPDDPVWSDWRREQIAGLMRKIYLKAIAVKPRIKVSSSVIAWGVGPVAEGDWENSRTCTEVFQDWRAWLEEGIIDQAMPMNYDREWDTAQKLWYDQWIEWEKDHQYNREIIIGPAIYMQYIEQSLDQIRRAQAPSQAENYAAGIALYSYGSTNIYGCDDYKDPNSSASKALPRQPQIFNLETNEWYYRMLSNPGGYTDPVLNTYIPTEPVFPTPAAIPKLRWKSHPVKGYIMGTVSDLNGDTYDHQKVTVEGPVTREAYTDGSGWFGLAELPPGHYRVKIDKADFVGRRMMSLWVILGRVTEVNFNQFWKRGYSGKCRSELELVNTAEMPEPFDEHK